MKFLLSSLLITFLLTVAFLTSQLISRLQSNLGMHHLMSGLVASSASVNSGLDPSTELLIAKALEWDKNNSTVWRAQGFVEWLRGNNGQAFQRWERLNLSAEDYVNYGRTRWIGYRNAAEALRWYELAEQVSPTFSKIWLDVGQICQIELPHSDICARFLDYNNGNLFVDPGFEFDRRGWRFNRREFVDYDIVDCPDSSVMNCAKVETLSGVSHPSVSWHQCFFIETGRTYEYSVWIKVDVDSASGWRPLYFQGVISGENRGNWPGDETESSDWKYWERTFVAPNFDGNRACFHPVVLFGSGKTWFYDAKLSLQ